MDYTMFSIDIPTLVSQIVRLLCRFRNNLSVVKTVIAAEHNQLAVNITNSFDVPVSILDAGFAGRHADQSFALRFVQESSRRVEFPKTIEPRTTLTVRIALGAVDLWSAEDVYIVFGSGKRKVYPCKRDLTSAR